MSAIQHGVYRIRNLVNGKVYIGSAASQGGFKKRWDKHLSDLFLEQHHSIKLQKAWKKYGPKAFIFEIIEIITRPKDMGDELWKLIILSREQYYLDTVLFAHSKDRSLFRDLGYNICRETKNCLGRKVSIETRAKLSKALKGRKISQAARVKISQANTGKKRSDEVKTKISKRLIGNQHTLGYKHSDETKAKISKALMGNQYNLGHKASKITREK